MPGGRGKSLAGRTLYIPRMSYEGACAMAAAFRSMGFAAEPTPEGDAHTYELARRFTTGDECLPELVTLGDILKIAERPDFVPEKTALMMPTSNGPCRFGQYRHLIAKVLQELGWGEVYLFSPTSADGYASIGRHARRLVRTAWWAVVVSDALRKLLLMTRPYEREPGSTERAFRRALDSVCSALSQQGLPLAGHRRLVVGSVEEARDLLRAVPKDMSQPRPLVGIVGEIFCRLNDFSNNQVIRRIEQFGGEVWISDVAEWAWYTNEEERVRLRREGRRWSLAMVGNRLRQAIMRADEHALLAPLAYEYHLRQEPPHTRAILARSRPYLPAEAALGEMVLNVGKAIWYYEHGAAAVVDVSPFSCMNGIVSEAVYPRVSRDLGGFPIRVLYFDGIQDNLDRDLDIFMEAARSFMARSPHAEKRVHSK
ncbi:MAG: hypothetical protein ONB30_13800 [candidate division KSB1 bacterium]|nr:hypothetical protein [candidate division KSB1 bacterium]